MRVNGLSTGQGYTPRPAESPGPAMTRGAPASTAPTDLRDLSPQAQLLLAARQAALQGMTERAGRVAELQGRVVAGTYAPDANQVCGALMDQLCQAEERS